MASHFSLRKGSFICFPNISYPPATGLIISSCQFSVWCVCTSGLVWRGERADRPGSHNCHFCHLSQHSAELIGDTANVELDFKKPWFLEYFPFKTLRCFLFPELWIPLSHSRNRRQNWQSHPSVLFVAPFFSAPGRFACWSHGMDLTGLCSSLFLFNVCIKDLTDKNQRPWTLILWFARLEKILKHFLHISGFLKWIEVL